MILTDDIYDEVLRFVSSSPPRESAFVHPSSLSCQRKIVFQLMKFPRMSTMDPEMRIMLDTGTALHKMVQEHLKKGIPVLHPGVKFIPEVRIDERLPRARKLCIHGYADGVIEASTGKSVWELKTLASNQFSVVASGNEPRPDHFEQVNLYMWCLEIEHGSIMYMCSQNQKLRKTFPVEFNQQVWEKTETKIRDALEAATEGRLPPAPETSQWTCRICPYSYTCVSKEEWCDGESLRSKASRIPNVGEGEETTSGDGLERTEEA